MKNVIKFRQPVHLARGINFDRWHYFGYLEDGFIGPVPINNSPHPGYQFSNMLDSSGKEVYEGDILGGGFIEPGVVILSDGGFRLDYKNDSGQKPTILTQDRVRRLLIVGNIVQNSEQLNAVVV